MTATHPISRLSTTGVGLTKGLDGYFYTPTSGGLQRFSTNLTSPAQTVAFVGGQGYGITTLPDGRIAYRAGSTLSNICIQVWHY